MQQASADGRILGGLVEALIGGSMLVAIMAVTFLLSATLMPNISRELPQLTGASSVVAARPHER